MVQSSSYPLHPLLLPSLPSITTIAVPHGGSAEVYLDPGGIGVNRLHLIFSGSPADLAAVKPRVTASVDGGPPQFLRQLQVSTGHFTDFLVLTPGRWVFHVTGRFGGSPIRSVRRPAKTREI